MMDEYCASCIGLDEETMEKIERRAVNLYLEQAVHNTPINPFDIIKNRGYEMIPLSYFMSNSTLSQNFIYDNDAFSLFDPIQKRYVIVYNDKKPEQRTRFTLMHEIGHIELGHKGESDLAQLMADYFAGYALAPSPLIHILADKSVDSVSIKFNVSRECASVCLKRYSLWQRIRRKDWADYEKRLLSLLKKEIPFA